MGTGPIFVFRLSCRDIIRLRHTSGLDMPATLWPAPAKLNLFLHVLGRRDDGYHALQTVFQLVDLEDRLTFTPRADGAVRRRSANADVEEANDLSVRAASLLKARSGCAAGVDIAVEKRIPMGGGLGGGSSDAATTLRALNRIWALGLDVDALAAIGLELGADVPVFVRGRSAFAEGVGERLEPVELDSPWYLIVDPGCSVSTARVFAEPALTRDSTPLRIRDLAPPGGGPLTARSLLRSARNDCEPVVRALYPQVDAALDWLAERGDARMTGTGACVFAPFEDRDAAHSVLEALPSEWRGCVARGMNRSALLSLV